MRRGAVEIWNPNDTAILAGMQIYHNYVRPHEALDGKTPSEAAGIEVRATTNG